MGWSENYSRHRRHWEWMAWLKYHRYPIKPMLDGMEHIRMQKLGEEAIKQEMEERLSKAKAKV